MHTVVMDTNRAALRGSRAGTDERGHDGARGQTESFALFTGLFSDIFTSELVALWAYLLWPCLLRLLICIFQK